MKSKAHLLKQIIDVPGDMIIFVIDKDLNYIFFNKNFYEYMITTFNKKVKIGDNIKEVFKGYKDLNKELSIFKRAFKGQEFSQVGNYELDGHMYYYKDIYKPIKNNKDETEAVAVYYTNITKRKYTERAWEILLSISEKVGGNEDLKNFIEFIRQQLSKLIDTTNFFVALYDEKQKMYSFPYFADEEDDINEVATYDLSKSATDYVRREGKPIILNAERFNELENNKTINRIGTPSPSWLGVPLKTKGKTIGVMVAQNYMQEDVYSEQDIDLLTFISGHIAHAVELKRTLETLDDTAKKLSYAYSIAKMGHWVINVNNKTATLSGGTRNILGFPDNKKEISFDELKKVIHAKDLDVILSAAYKDEVSEADFYIKNNRTKKIILVHTNFAADKKANKENIIIQGTIRDITKENEDKNELKKAKEKAEESDKLKSAFLANMSHEIRTPMNAIVGFSKLLSQGGLSEDKNKTYTEYISSSAKSLLKLINDIIDVAKIEAGQLGIKKKAVDINKILTELYESFLTERNRLNKDYIKIILDENIKETEHIVITDPLRLRQILTNLLGNAIKFIDKGFIEFGYTISNDNKLNFFVKDTGPGIPEGKQDLVFSRFGQVINDKIVHPGGTGLGLSISRHLVNVLGGDIKFESDEKSGTAFYFNIPNNAVDKEDDDEIEYSINLDIISNLKILIVEDNKVNQVLLYDLISNNTKDNEIFYADSGKDAVRIFKENIYDIVFMDIKLPDIDGYQVTEFIREYEGNKRRTPIIGLSAHAIKEFKEKSLQSGMDDFISKPFEFHEIFHVIEKFAVKGKQAKIKKSVKPQTTKLNYEFKHVDLSILLPIYGSDNEKLLNLLELSLKNISTNINELESFINNKEIAKIKSKSHSLKSSLGYLGLNEEAKKSKQIELNVKNQDLIITLLNEIKLKWEKASEELREYLKL